VKPHELGRKYIITDRHGVAPGSDLVEVIAASLAALPRGGAVVQLRERDLACRDLFALACRLVEVTRAHSCPLLINDRIDIALASGADGVHLPGRSFSIATARALGGEGFLVGVSTHNRAEAIAAAGAGVDLMVFGPVWPTPSKANAVALGIGELAATAAAVATMDSSYLYALGGVDGPAQASAAVAAGAHGVAGIRAFIAAADPAVATRAFARAMG
jgi:thiamine-phosphate pyrophosphorylase